MKMCCKTWKTYHVLLMMALILCCGCASIGRYYVPNPEVSSADVIDYDGYPDVELVIDGDIESCIAKREAQGYALVGSADYVGKDANWTGAMRRLGKTLGVEKIDYFKKYAGTDSATDVIPIQTTQLTPGTAWGTGGLGTMSMTTTQTSFVPYQYDVVKNEYHVLCYKKRLRPLPFGLKVSPVGEDLARQVGTRRAMVITSVVPDSFGWRNNLFKGDVILDVDGHVPTNGNVISLFGRANGKPMKIWRDGKVIEVILKDDHRTEH